MKVETFAEIEREFIERVFKVVWCAVATIDSHNRPRTRILHPIWEGTTGWIGVNPTSLKGKHIANNPHVSLAYIADITKPVYVEATAALVEDVVEKQKVWDAFKNAPAPMGYDPGTIWPSADHASFGVLRLKPWRINVANVPGESRIWQPGG